MNKERPKEEEWGCLFRPTSINCLFIFEVTETACWKNLSAATWLPSFRYSSAFSLASDFVLRDRDRGGRGCQGFHSKPEISLNCGYVVLSSFHPDFYCRPHFLRNSRSPALAGNGPPSSTTTGMTPSALRAATRVMQLFTNLRGRHTMFITRMACAHHARGSPVLGCELSLADLPSAAI